MNLCNRYFLAGDTASPMLVEAVGLRESPWLPAAPPLSMLCTSYALPLVSGTSISQPDRDTYILVILENLIHSRYAIHFEKISQALFKTVTDVGYDIQSIMHYSKFAFAITGRGIDRMTIIIKNDSGFGGVSKSQRVRENSSATKTN